MSGLDLTGLIIFAGALSIAAASPGPAIAAIVARVLGRGLSGLTPFIAGLMLGDVIWLTFAILGLAMVAQTFHEVFLAIRYAGAAYLLWLAWKLWSAPAGPQDVTGPAIPRERGLRSFLGGLALTMGNPKTMVFYLALLPNIIDLSGVTAPAYAELVVLILVILSVVFTAYALLAARARRLFASARAVKLLNRATGTVMAGAAVAVTTR